MLWTAYELKQQQFNKLVTSIVHYINAHKYWWILDYMWIRCESIIFLRPRPYVLITFILIGIVNLSPGSKYIIMILVSTSSRHRSTIMYMHTVIVHNLSLPLCGSVHYSSKFMCMCIVNNNDKVSMFFFVIFCAWSCNNDIMLVSIIPEGMCFNRDAQNTTCE